MFKKASDIIKDKKYLKDFLQKKRVEKQLKKLLSETGFETVTFKIKSKKEIYFFCPNHPTINLLRFKEEEIKNLLKEKKLIIRYFLENN